MLENTGKMTNTN